MPSLPRLKIREEACFYIAGVFDECLHLRQANSLYNQ